MRIVQVDNGLAIGGTLTMTANLSQGLRHGGHEVAAVVAADPVLAAPFFRGSAELHHMRLPYTYMHSHLVKHFFRGLPFERLAHPVGLLVDTALRPLNQIYVQRMKNFLKRWRPDVVHVNSGLEPIVAAASLGIPAVFHLHGLLPRKLERDQQRVFDKVSHFVAISKCVENAFVAAGFSQDKVSLVDNFLVAREGRDWTQAEARESLGLPQDQHIITLVGRIVAWKGPLEFVSAMIQLARRRQDVSFLLVGDASESGPEFVEAIRQRIALAGFTDRFRFVPHLADPFIAYRASSVVVHASIEPEPFGMVVIEAMAAGTPVVASPLGGPGEIIEDGVSGVLVDPRNAPALADAVHDLLDDAPRREAIVAAAKRRLQVRYGERHAIDALVKVYRGVTSATHAPAATDTVEGEV